MNDENIKAELERLRAENEALKKTSSKRQWQKWKWIT